MAQLGLERCVRDAEVGGSNPLAPIFKFYPARFGLIIDQSFLSFGQSGINENMPKKKKILLNAMDLGGFAEHYAASPYGHSKK